MRLASTGAASTAALPSRLPQTAAHVNASAPTRHSERNEGIGVSTRSFFVLRVRCVLSMPAAGRGAHQKSTILYSQTLNELWTARCRKFVCRSTATVSDHADALHLR